MNRVIFIYGPTAVGKSSVAIELAKRINGEIISADSMQIYKHLNIGSAKVTNEEMQGIKHHLIDIKMPNEDYSASDFCTDANNAINEILSKNKTPIIVGGTGLYIKSLISGYDFGGVVRNKSDIEKQNDFTTDELYNRVLELDPNCKIDAGNRRRLQRKLELLLNGMYQHKNVAFKYDYTLFCLTDDREKIYDRINKRVDNMINDGLIDEAKYLFSLNIPNSLAMKAIGYKELKPYVDGEMSIEECKNILKQKTRNYAKRQFTFMNQFDNPIIIKFDGINETTNKILEYLESNNG